MNHSAITASKKLVRAICLFLSGALFAPGLLQTMQSVWAAATPKMFESRSSRLLSNLIDPGVVLGTPTPAFPQASLRSLSLGGAGYLELSAGQSQSLNITGSITVEAWIKPANSKKMAIIERYVPSSTDGINGGYELRAAEDGSIRFVVYKDGSNSREVGSSFTTAINANQWHHVAGVFDNNSPKEMRLYIDGNLKDTNPITNFTYNTGTGTFRIGAKPDGGASQKFNGLIEDPRITAGVLYTGSTYTVPYPPLSSTVPNIRGLWRFDNSDATDSSGNNLHLLRLGTTGFSTDVPQTSNNAPTVSITSNGTNFTAPATITINATANDSDGQIASVTLLQNGANIGPMSGTAPNFSKTLTNVGAGTYNFQAVATDNQGSSGTSNTVSVTVSGSPGNIPPTVGITAPANGAVFAANTNITVSANASDSDGSVTRVEFYHGGSNLIGTDTTSPYSVVWNNVGAGNYSLTAKAFDNTGAATTSTAVNITVSGGASQTPFFGIPFAVPGTIQMEDFDNGGQDVAYHDNQLGNEWGSYRATDVDIAAPVSDTGGGFKIANAFAGEWLEYTVNVSTAGTYNIEVRVASGGPGGTLHVEFNGVNKTGTMIVPSTGSWDTWQTITSTGVSLSAGQQVMRISLDTNGTQQFPAVGDFNYIRITSGATALPPTVSVGTSGGPFNVPANITINATASAGTGRTISKVEFYNAAGNVKLGEDTTSPYSLQWRSVPAGSYTIKAKAIDNAGDFAEATTPVTVGDSAPGTIVFLSNLSPITTPVNGWGPMELDRSNGEAGGGDGQTIRLAGVAYAKGLGVHAHSEVRYNLIGGNYSNFVAEIGVDDEMADNGSIDFQVWADNDPTPLYNSRNFLGRAMTGQDATLSVNVNIAGKSTLILRVTDGGNGIDFDHSDWAGARLMVGSAPQPSPDFSVALVDPINRTGNTGEDLFSGNYNWTLPVLGLAGRANLDLSLSLTYNSLVWTKAGSSIKFNADNGFPGPGFRLGFPVVQAQRYTSQSGAQAYLLVTTTGGRVELRQTSPGSNIYEAADSSYLQLTDNGDNTLLVRSTDGTQFSYTKGNNLSEYECTQIKDRNGNFISVGYNGADRISAITDTLNRVINFRYDANGNPISIMQSWNGVPDSHAWARFEYQQRQITPSFSVSVIAPPNIQALVKVTLADNSSYSFDYTLFGQVNKITHLAPDGHILNYMSYDMNTGSGQTDCPRFTTRTDFAENWTTANTSFTFDRATGFGGQQTAPDGTTLRERYGTSGTLKGLITSSEMFSNDNLSTPKKSVTMTWEQDPDGKNPRVKETFITDSSGNSRRMSVNYTTFGLPVDVYEKDGNSIVLRKTHTDYLFDLEYTSRRIIGLPHMVSVYEGDGAVLVSKVRYGYDWDSFFIWPTDSAPTGHDPSYNNAFTKGRGNLSGVQRWDVSDPLNESKSIWVSQTGRFITGTPRFVTDANFRQTSFSYVDSFSDGNNARSTFAYPTVMANPDNFLSTAQYNYDMGAVMRLRDPKGAELRSEYNATTGRLVKRTYFDTVPEPDVAGTYARFEYPLSGNEIRRYILLDPGVEAYSTQVFDGGGRVIGTARNFPGSTSGYSGQKFVYNNMGRLVQQSNPAEILYSPGLPISNWNPTGDDTGGWLFTRQDYDWQGRPTVTTNTDQTTKTVGYEGCGCSGGDVVTTQDEMNRRRRLIYDALGRLKKTEVLNMNGSVYSTATNTYNARDQITRIFQQQGSTGTGQETLMTYDGHGRRNTSKASIESGPTIYEYNLDDTIRKITDPRGASATYTYNNRRLIKTITYAKPAGEGSEDEGPISEPNAIPAAPAVAFDYDAAGNRIWMTDGLGRVDYVYDTWSRLRSETRQFTGLSGSFGLSYEYNLAGQLTRLTDPFNSRVIYNYDQSGQLGSVAGSGPGSVPQYISQLSYRAWGAPKNITYGNNRTMTYGYNARLHLSSFSIPGVIGATLSHYADGRVRNSTDLVDRKFDRFYNYDHMGRLTEAFTGSEAGTGSPLQGPYRQTYQYDVWSNMTVRVGRLWSAPEDAYTTTYVNDRNAAWGYNASGQPTSQEAGLQNVYDAAGQLAKTISPSRRIGTINQPITLEYTYDGDGQLVKQGMNNTGKYFLRSSVLDGQTVADLTSFGQKNIGYVYANGRVIARQNFQGVRWVHYSPMNSSERHTIAGGAANGGAEYDPLHSSVGLEDPGPGGDGTSTELLYPSSGDPTDLSGGCLLDFMAVPCAVAMSFVNQGAGMVTDPYESPSIRWNPNQGAYEKFDPFADEADEDGYVPLGGSKTQTGGGGDPLKGIMASIAGGGSDDPDQDPKNPCINGKDQKTGLPCDNKPIRISVTINGQKPIRNVDPLKDPSLTEEARRDIIGERVFEESLKIEDRIFKASRSILQLASECIAKHEATYQEHYEKSFGNTEPQTWERFWWILSETVVVSKEGFPTLGGNTVVKKSIEDVQALMAKSNGIARCKSIARNALTKSGLPIPPSMR